MNRLKTATEHGGWAQTYVYDAYGNRALVMGSSTQYGIAPLVLSVSLFAVVGVLSVRWKESRRVGGSIATTVSFGVSAVVLFYIAMGLVGSLRK